MIDPVQRNRKQSTKAASAASKAIFIQILLSTKES
jgi:hypothetical protein